MPRNKSITSIDNRIKKVQEDLFKTKARLDKLTAELRGLEREEISSGRRHSSSAI
ncbi:MAG: hypothetical protein ACLTHV_06100 [Parasutterella excrementihominis]